MTLIYTLTFIYNFYIFNQHFEDAESYILSVLLTTLYTYIFNEKRNKINKT